MIYCPYCGGEIPDDVKCIKCGVPVRWWMWTE